MISQQIPPITIQSIKDHLIKNSKISENRWHSVKDEEDAATGDFCGQLTTPWTDFDKSDNQIGKWRINYKKFGSRKGSLENATGADGIIQIAIFDSFQKPIFRKGILFQAKKEPIAKKATFISQINDMSKYALGVGNSVLIFGENGYFGMTGDSYKKNPINRNFQEKDAIGNFLANKFMECLVGLEDLYFIVKEDKLFLPRQEPLEENLKHKLIFEINK